MVQNTDIPLPHSAALSFTPYPTRCRPVSHQDLLFHLSQNTASPDQWNRVILWDRCPSCERTISVKALNRTQSGLASRSSLHAGSALTVPEYSLQQMYPVFYTFADHELLNEQTSEKMPFTSHTPQFRTTRCDISGASGVFAYTDTHLWYLCLCLCWSNSP